MSTDHELQGLRNIAESLHESASRRIRLREQLDRDHKMYGVSFIRVDRDGTEHRVDPQDVQPD